MTKTVKKESPAPKATKIASSKATKAPAKVKRVAATKRAVKRAVLPTKEKAKSKHLTKSVSEHSKEEINIAHISARKAAQYALEKKATAIKILDLTGITSMTDYFVIASGDSDRQVKAIGESVIVGMRDEAGVAPWRSEGWDGLQWILIDFVDFVVHIFQAEAREFYSLDRLWADAPSEEVKDEPPILPPMKTTKKPAAKSRASSKAKAASIDEEAGTLMPSGVRVISGFLEVKNRK